MVEAPRNNPERLSPLAEHCAALPSSNTFKNNLSFLMSLSWSFRAYSAFLRPAGVFRHQTSITVPISCKLIYNSKFWLVAYSFDNVLK